MKKGNKTVSMVLVVYGIIAALLNLIIFAVFRPAQLETDNMKLVFWFAYAFIMLAFVFQLVSVFTGRFENGVESVFFGLPLIKVSIMYFAVTTILSLVFMILVSVGVDVPFMLVIVLECIVLGLYAIAYIISLTNKNFVVEIDKKIKTNVIAIRNLVTDVECMADGVEDADTKKKLNRLAEDIRYSDPMTTNIVADLELQIRDSIAELEVLVADNDIEAIQSKVKQTQMLLAKRNRRLADNK